MRSWLAPLVGSCVLVGCGGMSKEEFPEARAEAFCSYWDYCGWLYFEGLSFDTCLSEKEQGTINIIADESCRYSPRVAQECVDYLLDAPCGDISDDPCTKVCG